VGLLTAKPVEHLERWAGRLKAETYALYLAYKDPRVPWYARLFAACVVGYAFSPIDLIPDPIPVLGYLDDLVLIPLGIALAVRMIPRMFSPSAARRPGRSRQKAGRSIESRRLSWSLCGSLWPYWRSIS
jgi:uncharacterized membrane protein YkvA (DUF1232 family)